MGTHVIAVVGATATGKSGLGVGLARALGGEVVNADSMQLYRGMDIGTAKEPEAARQGVPHHLLDIWPVTRTANVADYQHLARAAIDDIIVRGRVPVLVGGSGLYIRAALDDLNFPGTNQAIRSRLTDELGRVGAAALHARLATLDPAAAGAILPSNGRRIVRALEVIEISGGPFTATMPGYGQARPAVQIGLTLPRPDLDQRIAARVERMWESGFETEVRALIAVGLRQGKTASRALGYQQMLRHLDGELTLDEAREETVKATKRFARRQESWFRRDPRVRWLDASAPADSLLTDTLRCLLPVITKDLVSRNVVIPSRSWSARVTDGSVGRVVPGFAFGEEAGGFGATLGAAGVGVHGYDVADFGSTPATCWTARASSTLSTRHPAPGAGCGGDQAVRRWASSRTSRGSASATSSRGSRSASVVSARKQTAMLTSCSGRWMTSIRSPARISPDSITRK
jgi:tRNA dimethylallyltransferase